MEQRDLLEANYRACYGELTQVYLDHIKKSLNQKYPNESIYFDHVIADIQLGLDHIIPGTKPIYQQQNPKLQRVNLSY